MREWSLDKADQICAFFVYQSNRGDEDRLQFHEQLQK
jgi:hypothetical protein